ncbi:MAG TPA: hypothetical protein VLO31_00190, partial [Cryobacterium sp.]|nr:hypothetical protein [Cryobacterium sp.]
MTPKETTVTSPDRASAERRRVTADNTRRRHVEVEGYQFTVHSLSSTSRAPEVPTYLMVHGIGASYRYFRRM